MDFGSSHVYAGAPYYSDVPKEDAPNQSIPQPQTYPETIYEAVPEMYQQAGQDPSQTSGDDQHAYDPVCFDEEEDNSRRDYDLVPYEPNLDAINNNHQPAPISIPTRPAPPKRSLSAAVLHKAIKVTNWRNKKNKPIKSDSSMPESMPVVPPALPPPRQNIRDKPLPPIPNAAPASNGAPELPAPRLPPKPKMYQSIRVAEKLPPKTILPIDEIVTMLASNTMVNSGPEPMKPTILTPKPLYPTLPNVYGDINQNYDRPGKMATAPPADTLVKSKFNFDLIDFDEQETILYVAPNGFNKAKDEKLGKTATSATQPPSAPKLSSSMVKRDTRATQPKNVYAAADTNVVSVKLGILEKTDNSMVWAMPPLRCKKCQAVLLHHALAKNQGAGICRFCGSSNADITEATLPLVGNESDITYVLSQEAPVTSDDPIIVFCVDTSGSMCVTSEMHGCFMSRLRGVQEGILSQLHQLRQSRPKVRVAIVTFSNMVTLLGDGSSSQYMTLCDAQLYDTDYIKTVARTILLPGCIADTHDQLTKTVNMLKEHGGTALGPALFLSVALASRKCRSQVIVCTDGRANVGIGSLELESDYKMCHHFYKETSEYGTQSGTVVSILSIEGTDCRLVELGKVADRTAGKVKIADSQNIAEEFNDILSTSLMATRVAVNIVTQKELCFDDGATDCKSLVKSFVGNATRDTEVTFKYGIPENEEDSAPESAMFQLQVKYLLANGCTCLRVITQSRPVTENRILAEQGLNPVVVGTYASQLASKLVLDGDLRDAKLTTDAHKKLIHRAMSIRSMYGAQGESEYNIADDNRIYGSVCSHFDEFDKEIIDQVTGSIRPTPSPVPDNERPPPLPPRPSESPLNLSRSSSISSLSLPDVPDTPLPSRERLKEAVEHCPDEVARKLYKHRNACGKMFSAC